MGMFDNVVCDYPLPDERAKEVREWQTKSFEWPFLDTYRITPEGRLLHQEWHMEEDPTRPPLGLDPFVPAMTRVNDGWTDVEYHGVLNFYGNVGDNYDGANWYEYNATFTHGHLEKIERMKSYHEAVAESVNECSGQVAAPSSTHLGEDDVR